MNTYLIEFSIHDGEAEYWQVALLQATLQEEAKEQAAKILQQGGYEGDYRLYEVESVTQLSPLQLQVIRELGLAYEL